MFVYLTTNFMIRNYMKELLKNMNIILCTLICIYAKMCISQNFNLSCMFCINKHLTFSSTSFMFHAHFSYFFYQIYCVAYFFVKSFMFCCSQINMLVKETKNWYILHFCFHWLSFFHPVHFFEWISTSKNNIKN